MKKMIIFLCLIVVLIAQINYTASAQTAYPYPTGYPTSDPDPTSYPDDTGPIAAGTPDPCKNKVLCSPSGDGCCRTGKCTPTRAGWACK